MTTTWLTAAVTAADDAVRNAAHQGGGELAPLSVPDLSDLNPRVVPSVGGVSGV